MTAKPIIDSTKLSDYLRCPRYYALRHVLGWTLDHPNRHLIVGSAWHEALRAMLEPNITDPSTGYDPDLGWSRFLEVYRTTYPERTDPDFKSKSLTSIEAQLRAYASAYSQDFTKRTLIAVETWGSTSLGLPYPIHFKWDSVWHTNDRGYYIQEHKTTTKLTQRYLDSFPLSIQLGTYTQALKASFPEAWGVELNIVAFDKPTMLRIPMTPNMSAWQDTCWNALTQLLDKTEDWESSGNLRDWPMNPLGCDKYYGCEFFSHCTGPTPNTPELPAGFKVEFWDPRKEL